MKHLRPLSFSLCLFLSIYSLDLGSAIIELSIEAFPEDKFDLFENKSSFSPVNINYDDICGPIVILLPNLLAYY